MGFSVVSRSTGALAWRRCLRRSLCLSWVLLSPWCSRRQVRARAPPLYLALACLRVWAHHLLLLCPRACGLCVWWRSGPLWWCVAPVSRFHRGGVPFIPSLLPVRYSLIPLMFRSSVLAASCSSRVPWRRPHFLRRRRLPPALMALFVSTRMGDHESLEAGGGRVEEVFN